LGILYHGQPGPQAKSAKKWGLDFLAGHGMMVMMNKLKYWILVTAALIKVFTPAIATAGAAFIFHGTVLGDMCTILGIISIGWIKEVKLPEKPE
jgi:hypothetical protein